MEKKVNPMEKMGRKWKTRGKMPSCLDMENQEKYTLYNIVSENGNGEENMKKGLAFTIAVLLCLLTAVLPAMKPVQAATANDYQVEVYGSGNQGLPLNISPDSDSAFYVTLMEGTPLHIDQVSDGFGHVFYNGLSGWVQLHYTRIVGDYPVLQPSSGWVSPADYQVCNTDGEGLELRGGPSSDYSTFGSMSDGDIFTVEAVSGNWAYGRYNGVSGWAYMSYLQYVGPAAAAPASSASLQSKVVTIGSDLTDEQEAFILQYFGADLSSCRVIYVTNQQEREYLGSWIPLSEIGNITISSAYVQPTQSGGIQVKTANLTYVTGNMIASVLSTAGVKNCNVVAAAPFPVSGTGALTGVMIAYQNAADTTLEEEKRELAIQEFTVTQQLSDSIGPEEALQLVNAVKMEVIRSGEEQESEPVEAIVDQVIVNMEQSIVDNSVTNIDQSTVTILNGLSEEERQLLMNLAEQIAEQNYNYEDVKETLERVEQNLSEQTNISAGTVPVPEDTAEPTAAEPMAPDLPEADTNIPAPEEDSILSGTNDSLIDPSMQSDTRQETGDSALFEGIFTSWYEAYLELLYRVTPLLQAYDYQMDLYGGIPSRNIAFCDVYGDDTPEFLYIAIEPVDGIDEAFCPAWLHIVTFENGSLRELYAYDLDKGKATGGFSYYYLFQVEGEKTLYEFTDRGDESGTRQYCRYVPTADARLKKEQICSLSRDWDGTVTQCIVNGADSSADAFDLTAADLQNRTVCLVMYKPGVEFADSYESWYGCMAMGYEEAYAFLTDVIYAATQQEPSEEETIADWTEPAAEVPADINGSAGWQDAYYDFIMNGGYLYESDIYPEQGLAGGVRFSLCDINEEEYSNVPELIVDNNADGMSWACSIIYGFRDGQMVRLGNTDWHSIAYKAGESGTAPGLFASNFYYLKYYYLTIDGTLHDESVRTGEMDRETGEVLYTIFNDYLNDIYENYTVELQYYYKEDIDAMGWDAFCATFVPRW